MSLAALSMAALPAATGVAAQVAQASRRVGSGFLSALTQIAAPGDQPNLTTSSPTETQSSGLDSKPSARSALSDKTQAWCQRLMNWLSQHQPSGDLDIQLSLDSLDGPQVAVDGQGADAIDSALADDPTWLQEFRELALDRIDEQGPGSPVAPRLASPTLNLTRRNGQTQARWN